MATLSSRYGIYQWEGSDPVKREEFNHNFSVLEEALYNRHTFLPLFSVTNSTEAQMVSIDMSSVEWEKFHEVIIEIWHPTKVTTSGQIFVNQVTGIKTETYGCVMSPPVSGSGASILEGLGRIDGHRGRVKFISNLHANADIATEICSLNNQRNYKGWKMDTTLQQISTIDYYNYSKVPVGTEFTVWGVR